MKPEFRRIHENDELLPAPVCSFLMPYAEAFDIRTAKIDPAFADGENMHTQYGVNYEEELNCAKKVSFAPLELVTELSGQEYGSITPVGLPQDWLVLVDASVMEQDRVVIGGGLAHSKLQIPTALFKEMANAVIVEGLAKE